MTFKICSVALLAAALIGVQARTVMGQQPDPYAEAEASHYAQQRKALLDSTRILYFAAGCSVYLGPSTLQSVYAQMILGDEYRLLQRERGWASDRDLSSAITEAQRDGLARAKQAGACDYWHQNPEAVIRLRQAQRAAAP